MLSHQEKLRAVNLAWEVVRWSVQKDFDRLEDMLVAMKAETREFQEQVLEFVETIRDAARSAILEDAPSFGKEVA